MFLTFRKFRFSLGSRPSAPYFIVHQKAINAKIACHHFNKPIKNNMAVLKWYTSNAVNILYVCYFLKVPKILSRLLSLFFFFTTSAYTGQCTVLCLWQFKTCSSHFSFFLHPFSLSLFFLSFVLFFFWGWGGLRKSTLGYKGGQPQIISNEQGGQHIQQELSVNFHHPP